MPFIPLRSWTPVRQFQPSLHPNKTCARWLAGCERSGLRQSAANGSIPGDGGGAGALRRFGMNGSGTARILSRLWLLVIAVVAITVLYLAKVLFLPLAFAILFAFLLAPVVTLLERMRLPRALAAIVVILSFAALLGMAAWMLFTQLVAVAN